jgi:hypothetical protein
MTDLEKTTKKIDWLVWTVVVVGISGGVWFQRKSQVEESIALSKRREIICPSLLSIGRSSRDTLIIMKNEDLCNQFVLDNLK